MTDKKENKPQPKPSNQTKTFDINQENYPEIWEILQPPKDNNKR